MPIALNMSYGQEPENDMVSPTASRGGRMTKAAFFRARSPPIVSPINSKGQGSDAIGDGMIERFGMATLMEPSPSNTSLRSAYGEERDRFPVETGNGSGYERERERAAGLNVPMRESMYQHTPATDGHGAFMDRPVNHPVNPASTALPSASTSSESTLQTVRQPYSHNRQSSRSRPTHSRQQSSHSQAAQSGMPGVSAMSLGMGMMSPPTSDSGYGESMETYDRSPSMRDGASVSLTEGSDEMLLALLAGQAAMECEGMGIGGWEEVEGWKKELSLLAGRLETAQSRHQRETKILTAARALQKLNNSNKRMSKQTSESLEVAEKKVDAAEKDLLILRDREGRLRRRLLEHYSSAMSWEVRRLTQTSSVMQVKLEHQTHSLAAIAQREGELSQEVVEGQRKVEELETAVREMSRREHGMQEEVTHLQEQLQALAQEKESWFYEREHFDEERQMWSEEKREWNKHLDNWDAEREQWKEEKEVLFGDREKLMQGGMASENDRRIKDHVRSTLGSLLGRKSGPVNEEEIASALEEVGGLLLRREQEVLSLKEEVREVNMGLEEELRRLSEDRNSWKGKLEKNESSRREEITSLEKNLRRQQDQISDLSLRNESLSTSLSAAQTTMSVLPSPNTSQATEIRLQSLTSELEEIHNQFASIWPLLPSRSLREDANLVDSRTGESNRALISPSNSVNFEALQKLYSSSADSIQGREAGSVPEALERIKWMVADGKLLVDRVVRMGKERDTLKMNAAKAKKLVESSTRSLETYQQQVILLEDRLAKSSHSESSFLEELNSLQTALSAAQQSKQQVEMQLAKQTDICARLSEANDVLSTRALDMAQVAEDEKRNLAGRLQRELEEVQRKLKNTEEDADEERAKSSGQRLQLLDELNSLQAEVGALRKQLRAKA